ncbi:MAG: molecular chaperone DnaJ, partial [Propionibacteriales bacterium]|nr:molecular chaperone DnaJ [Propionibacteriales bacterium]
DLFRSGDSQGAGDIFGGLFNQGGRRNTRGPRRGHDVEGEATISFSDAAEGVTVPLEMVSDAPCATCHGTGAEAGSMPIVCPVCEGSGMQTSTAGGVFALNEPCHECRGRGMVIEHPCPTCHGSGRGKSTKHMNVRIPAGVSDGARIRLKGKGGAGENGGASGDLYVIVHVSSHALFGRKGRDLTVTVPITYPEAVLGAEVEVPTLNGPAVRVRIAPGTPNGRVLRVRGKGVGKADGTHGDLLVTVEVTVPAAVDDSAREALATYREHSKEPNPRGALFARNVS